MNTRTIAEWGGAFMGLLGAALLATNSDISGWGFVAFLVSNLFWIAFGVLNKTYGLLLMQTGFTLTSILGVYRWLLA